MRRRSFLARAAIVPAAALLLCVVLTAGTAHAETKPLNPFAAPGAMAPSAPGTPPSAFAPPTAAPLHASGPIGAVLSWVVDTQQSLQRQLATGVKSLKTDNAIAGAMTLAALSFI